MKSLPANHYALIAERFIQLEESLRNRLVQSSFHEFTAYQWPSMATYQNKRNGHVRFTMEEIETILKAVPELNHQLELLAEYDQLRRRLYGDLLISQIPLKLLFSRNLAQSGFITAWKGPKVISYQQFLLRGKDFTYWTAAEIKAVSIRLAEYIQQLTELINPISGVISVPAYTLVEKKTHKKRVNPPAS